MHRRDRSVLIRLLSFATAYWRQILVAWFCVAGQAAFVLVMPLMLRWAIDVGLDVRFENGVQVAHGHKQTLVWLAVGMVGVAALRGVFAYGQTYWGEWITASTTTCSASASPTTTRRKPDS
jgi:ABC-type multidrug transport system fused ATPase/permease subunit